MQCNTTDMILVKHVDKDVKSIICALTQAAVFRFVSSHDMILHRSILQL